MRRIVKAILALAVLVLFIGTVGILGSLVELPWISQEIEWLIFWHPEIASFLKVVLIIIGVLLCLIALVVLFIPGKRQRLVIKTNKNRIVIPKSTIEQLIETSYRSFVPRDLTKVTVKIKRNKRVLVFMKIDVANKHAFQSTLTEIKEHVHADLLTALEPVENQVTIRLREKDLRRSSVFSKKRSRVV